MIRLSLPGGEVLFTDRAGGVSEGPFASLNLGGLTADAPEAVAENRARVAAAIGIGVERWLRGRQVHGTTVRRATAPPGPDWARQEQDGQATALRQAAALVLTADCLPVVLTAPGGVAAVHAGWRGLAGGVIEEGLAALRDLGTEATHAALGPAARGCCYEVGEEVHARFEAGFRDGRRIDLAGIASARLRAAGVDVHDTGLCTMCEPERFFSHRRSGGTTGRQAAIAWRS